MKPARIQIDNLTINFNQEATNADPFSQFLRIAIRSGEVDAIARSIKERDIPITDRFTKYADGKPVSIECTTWDSVFDSKTGIMWDADLSKDEHDWNGAIKAASEVKIGGHAFRAPDLDEQLSIRDLTKFNPAMDTRYFRGGTDSVWTATPLASSPSGCAWFVDFNGGYSYYVDQVGRRRVRACRSFAPVSQ